MPVERFYPMAEEFISPQGEGTHTGLNMYFLRLAGCNVGVAYNTPERRELLTADQRLTIVNNPQHTLCETVLGQQFVCDTEYKAKMKFTPAQIINRIKTLTSAVPGMLCKDVCITGGEPLMHDLVTLIKALKEAGYRSHIETSGSLPITRNLFEVAYHITCSPKKGYMRENAWAVQDFKFVVDTQVPDFDDADFIHKVDKLAADNLDAAVYIQPANPINDVNLLGLHHICSRILPLRPGWRLSPQLHKFLRVR